MCKGERPIGAAKGKQTNSMTLYPPPPPPPPCPRAPTSHNFLNPPPPPPAQWVDKPPMPGGFPQRQTRTYTQSYQAAFSLSLCAPPPPPDVYLLVGLWGRGWPRPALLLLGLSVPHSGHHNSGHPPSLTIRTEAPGRAALHVSDAAQCSTAVGRLVPGAASTVGCA